MGSLQLTVMVEGFQVLADGNLRRAEMFGKIPHQDTAIRAQELQDFATPFLAQHMTVSPAFLDELRQRLHMNLVF
jgi:hypothetical protein